MEGCAQRRIGGRSSLLTATFRLSTGRVSAGTEGTVIAAGRVMVAPATHRASYWRHHLFGSNPMLRPARLRAYADQTAKRLMARSRDQ